MGSKISQKISFSPVFLPANVLSSLSLSLPATSSALGGPTETFLLHQQVMSQSPHEPKSSPARSSLSPLQIFFFCFFFFLPPPLNTVSSAVEHPTKTFLLHQQTVLQWQRSHYVSLLSFLSSFSPLQISSFSSSSSCSRSSQLRQPTPPPFPTSASGHPPLPASHHRHARWSTTLPLVLHLPHESSTILNGGT